MHRALFAAALALLASPALADAVTYTGTLGKTSIVVELTSDPATATTPFAGRYFYASKGIDIPLDGVSAKGGKLTLNEEAPCTETTCALDDDGYVTKFPIGGKWTLAASADGKTLSGTWQSKGKALPIALTQAGTRTLPDDTEMTPLGLGAIVADIAMGEAVITRQTSPYDFLRMDVPPTKSDPTTMEGSTFQYLSDPRTKFQFPTILSLKDGSDPSAANAYLRSVHWSMNADAFDCEARQYAGFDWSASVGYAAGTYGGYTENEFTEVQGLTPKILSYLESGSTDCGYAHPNNHAEYNNIDIAAGQPLDLSRIFTGWRKSDDENGAGPSKELADFVRSHLKDPGLNLADPEECDYDTLVGTNLAVAFKPGNKVLLTLDGLEYAIQACGADLWEGPITELKPYLAPTAADYFPVLKN